jgi:thioesterase domain-containing protein
MLLEHRTIRSLANKLGGAIAISTSEVVRFNNDVDVAPMFCVPGGGGTAINFQRLAECFSYRHSLAVIEAHGMHTLGKPDRSITAMAERVLAVVAETHPEGPVTLVGYSAGGFVAWEAAKSLAENGRQPRVVIIDSYFDPDSLPSGRNPWGPAPQELAPLRKFVRACRSRVAGVRNRWREFRPGPPRADEVRYRAFSRILSKALRHYEPGAATFPVLYLSAEDSPDRHYWKSRAENLTNVAVTGDHLTMLDYPNVELVASTITEWINSLVDSEPKLR